MEFALAVPIVLLLAFAVIEIAVVAQRQLEVTHAAREGAREAAANPDPVAATAAVNRALGAAAAAARITITRDHIVGGEASAEVVLPHLVASPLLGGLEIVLVGKAVMRVER